MYESIWETVQEELSDAEEIVAEAHKRYESGLVESDELKAVKFFMEADDLVPDYLDAWIKMSETCVHLSLLDKAVKCCVKAHEIDCSNIQDLLRMGDLVHRLEWFEQSIHYYELVLENEPENTVAWFGLAAVHKDTQCYVQAVTCWENILLILDARKL